MAKQDSHNNNKDSFVVSKPQAQFIPNLRARTKFFQAQMVFALFTDRESDDVGEVHEALEQFEEDGQGTSSKSKRLFIKEAKAYAQMIIDDCDVSTENMRCIREPRIQFDVSEYVYSQTNAMRAYELALIAIELHAELEGLCQSFVDHICRFVSDVGYTREKFVVELLKDVDVKLSKAATRVTESDDNAKGDSTATQKRSRVTCGDSESVNSDEGQENEGERDNDDEDEEEDDDDDDDDDRPKKKHKSAPNIRSVSKLFLELMNTFVRFKVFTNGNNLRANWPMITYDATLMLALLIAHAPNLEDITFKACCFVGTFHSQDGVTLTRKGDEEEEFDRIPTRATKDLVALVHKLIKKNFRLADAATTE